MNLGLFIPEITLVVFAILVVLADLFTDRKEFLIGIALLGIAFSAVLSSFFWGVKPQITFYNMLVVDNFAVFFKLLFLGIAAMVILASVDYMPKMAKLKGEFYALVMMSTLGMMLMAATTELISIYVALELTSISLYILVGFLKDQKSTEASLKYLLLGAIASAVLLYGMALIFGFTGKTNLAEIARVIQAMSPDSVLASPGLILGIVLMLAGFGFKIAAVPFHMWVPDVYEGSPTPITAYLSVASKAAGFAVLIRVFFTAFGLPEALSSNWGLIFAVLAAIGMFAGNIAAIPQSNIKRLLGYSSIAQAGYLLVGLATVGVSPLTDTLGRSILLFFLTSYALTNLGAFFAIIAITNKINSDEIKDFAGVGKRSPGLAMALTLCLVSLIGMPPAAGFMAKFYLFSAAVRYDLLWLVIIAVINSVISAYYYLRVVKVMWLEEPASVEGVPSSAAMKLALTVSCAGVLALGLAPGVGIRIADLATKMFGV